jgi:Uma2 family endonuclease
MNTLPANQYIELEFEPDRENPEARKVSSLNHSLVQSRLVKAIDEQQFTIATELSLDISKNDFSKTLKAKEELKPDICLYSAADEEIDFLDSSEQDDLLKVSKMPLVAIEILSPTQGNREILANIRAYFALGIKSCWLVDPGVKTITVYTSPNHSKTYDMEDAEVIDNTLNLRLPLQKIFFTKKAMNKAVVKPQTPNMLDERL